MGTYFADFDTTPANLVATLKTEIVKSTDWAVLTGNIVKATTARGAQMVIDLTDAAITAQRLTLGIYVTHNGTTGTNKVQRFLSWRTWTTGATTDPVHVQLSVGRDHFYLAIEGPRPGENNPDDATYGSMRLPVFLGDIVPYFGSDTVPAVLLVANPNSAQYSSEVAHVSVNAANNAFWVPAHLGSLQVPRSDIPSQTYSLKRECAADGNTYLWPYVVIEDTAGLRGRISKCFFAGFNRTGGTAVVDPQPIAYARYVYNSENYVLLAPVKSQTQSQQQSRTPFGYIGGGIQGGQYSSDSPIIAVPVA